MRTETPKPFDRRTTDIPFNAVLVPVEVDEPSPLSGEAPDRIVLMRNLRTDPLAWMQSHGRLDDAQFLAGRRWQELYERCEMGAIQAFDTSKDPVDGGGSGAADLSTEGQRQAFRQLEMAAKTLVASVADRERGADRVRLVRDILGDLVMPTRAAAMRGLSGEYQVRKLSREFVRCLDVLALSFGWQQTCQNSN